MPTTNGVATSTPLFAPMSITVGGFKSIAREQTVDIRPLTILAGANSSGKSSLMQAVLLIKQTLESSYDAGPLLINGPHVRFSQYSQMFTRCKQDQIPFTIGIRAGTDKILSSYNINTQLSSLDLVSTSYGLTNIIAIDRTTSSKDILGTYSTEIIRLLTAAGRLPKGAVARKRTWLVPRIISDNDDIKSVYDQHPVLEVIDSINDIIHRILHLPGLRAKPERQYPSALYRIGTTGPFDSYTASLLHLWASADHERIEMLTKQLVLLKLTNTVAVSQKDDVSYEIQVGRMPVTQPSKHTDTVNIADVGLGVSQVLPVLVALLVAEPDQIVYIEQPELHLHPRAQVAMGRILADAANRGVRVVIVTHSSLLLLGIQSQVAEGYLDPRRIILHWFNRNESDGSTDIISADVEADGSFPNWPEDFDDVTLEAQQRYLDLVEKRQVRK